MHFSHVHAATLGRPTLGGSSSGRYHDHWISMIRAAIVCPDQELAAQLQDTLAEFHTRIGIARVLHQYPNEAKLPAFLKATLPELIFLSAEKVDDAVDVVQRIKADAPGTAVVAISRECDGPSMLKVL